MEGEKRKVTQKCWKKKVTMVQKVVVGNVSHNISKYTVKYN